MISGDYSDWNGSGEVCRVRNVKGGWHGKYINKAENKDYEVMSGGCEGNIVSSMIYVDENGVEDKSKLFFIPPGQERWIRSFRGNDKGGNSKF